MIHTDGTPTIAHREAPCPKRGHAIPGNVSPVQVAKLTTLLDPMRPKESK